MALEPKEEAEIEVVISEIHALQVKAVEEIPAFTFRIKSLSKMYRQKNKFAFNQKNVHM